MSAGPPKAPAPTPSVRRSLFWMAVTQAMLFVIQFAATVIIARLLSPYEIGVYTLGFALLAIVGAIRATGFDRYIIRADPLGPEILTVAFSLNALTGFLSAAFIGLLGLAGGAWLGDPAVHQVMIVLAITPLINTFEFLPIACLEREGEFRIIGLISSSKAMAAAIVSILLALYGFSSMSLAWAWVASSTVGAVGATVVGWRYASFRFGLRGWRPAARFGMQMFAVNSISTVTARALDLLVGRLAGLTALGLYSRASGLHGLVWENLHAVVARVVFVDLAEQRRRGIPLRDSYLRTIRVMTALLWPAFCGMAVVAGPLIQTMYGPNWTEAALPLALLAMSGVLMTTNAMAYEIFVVSGAFNRLIRLEAVRNIAGLALFAPACLAGLGWAAAARIAGAAVAILVYRPHLSRLTGTKVRELLPIYLEAAALTLAACAPAAAVMQAAGWSPATPLPRLGAAIVGGMACWALGLALCRHPLFNEALAFLKRFRR